MRYLKDLVYYDKWRMPKFEKARLALSTSLNYAKKTAVSAKNSKWSKRAMKSLAVAGIVVAIIYIIRALWSLVMKWMNGLYEALTEKFPMLSVISPYLWYVWYAFWVIFSVTIVYLSFRLVYRQFRQVWPATPKVPGSENGRMPIVEIDLGVQWEKWLKPLTLSILVVGCVIALFYEILPFWTETKLSLDGLVLIRLGAILLVAFLILGSKVPFHKKGAFVIKYLGIPIFILFLIFDQKFVRDKAEEWRLGMWPAITEGNIFAGSGDTNSTTFGKSAEALKLRGSTTHVAKWNSDGFKLANVFWAANTTPDGVTASEANDMIMYCVVESGCNQFGTDGKPLRNIPNAKGEQSSAIGFYQIISGGLHNDFLDQLNAVPGHPSYDLNTLEGQFNFALALVKRRKANGEPFDADWAVSREKLKTLQERIKSGAASFSDPSTLFPEEEPETAPPAEKKQVEAPDEATPSGNCKEVVIETEFGVWSRWVEIGEGATLWSEGNFLQIQDDQNRFWPIPRHLQSAPYKITTRTKRVRFQSFSGSPDGEPATVHLTPCK